MTAQLTTPSWFTRHRYQVVEAASCRRLFRADSRHGSGARFFESSKPSGMAQTTLNVTVGSLITRGLARVHPDYTDEGYRAVRLTDWGKTVRTQWFREPGRRLPFPFPALIEPPSHTPARHYVLFLATSGQRPRLGTPMPVSAAEAMNEFVASGLINPKEHFSPYALTEQGCALWVGWRSLSRNLCQCVFPRTAADIAG